MNQKMKRPVYWPDETQELLLQACLGRGERARAAWQQWIAQVDIDHLDNGANRLLPLLYHNLQREKVEHPVMDRLKGIYRFYWAQNQLLFHQAGAPMLAALQAHGIKTMLLKGTALVTRHYQDPGLRPMGDFDFLVPTEKKREAFALVMAAGWRIADANISTEKALDACYAGYFVNQRQQHLDLHWNMLCECQQADADADFWAQAEPVKIGGVETLCPCPTDLLLHVCVHGAVWSTMPPIRWVADAIYILNTSPHGIDWDRLVQQASQRQLALPLHLTLSYLQQKLDAAIPAAVLETLQRHGQSPMERLEYAFKCRPHGLLGGFPIHFFNHWRQERMSSLPRKLWRFPGYLQRRWSLPSRWVIPLFMMIKLRERVRLCFSRQTTG